MTLKVVAHLKARADMVEEAREVLEALIEPTRAEPGCLGYELFQSPADPTQLTFLEEWRDETDLAAHFETDHIKAALVKFSGLFAEDLDLRRYNKVG